MTEEAMMNSTQFESPGSDRAASCGLVALVVFLMAVQPMAASAEEPTFRMEIHPVATMAVTTPQVLAGENGTPVTIGGELRLPTSAEGRLPVVVFVHGAGGVYGNEDTWAEELNRLGVAVFILDTFTGRGFINPTSTVGQTKDAMAVSGFVMIVDAYRDSGCWRSILGSIRIESLSWASRAVG
jgi:hypothetical protein